MPAPTTAMSWSTVPTEVLRRRQSSRTADATDLMSHPPATIRDAPRWPYEPVTDRSAAASPPWAPAVTQGEVIARVPLVSLWRRPCIDQAKRAGTSAPAHLGRYRLFR